MKQLAVVSWLLLLLWRGGGKDRVTSINSKPSQGSWDLLPQDWAPLKVAFSFLFFFPPNLTLTVWKHRDLDENHPAPSFPLSFVGFMTNLCLTFLKIHFLKKKTTFRCSAFQPALVRRREGCQQVEGLRADAWNPLLLSDSGKHAAVERPDLFWAWIAGARNAKEQRWNNWYEDREA